MEIGIYSYWNFLINCNTNWFSLHQDQDTFQKQFTNFSSNNKLRILLWMWFFLIRQIYFNFFFTQGFPCLWMAKKISSVFYLTTFWSQKYIWFEEKRPRFWFWTLSWAVSIKTSLNRNLQIENQMCQRKKKSFQGLQSKDSRVFNCFKIDK